MDLIKKGNSWNWVYIVKYLLLKTEKKWDFTAGFFLARLLWLICLLAPPRDATWRDLFGAVHMCGFIFHIAFKKPKFHLVKIQGK